MDNSYLGHSRRHNWPQTILQHHTLPRRRIWYRRRWSERLHHTWRSYRLFGLWRRRKVRSSCLSLLLRYAVLWLHGFRYLVISVFFCPFLSRATIRRTLRLTVFPFTFPCDAQLTRRRYVCTQHGLPLSYHELTALLLVQAHFSSNISPNRIRFVRLRA